jgi:hypothetical protein
VLVHGAWVWRQQPGWQVVEMARGPVPMLQQPDAMVRHRI